MANVDEILRGHVTLEVKCVDRLYLNGYIPKLATPGGLVTFMREQLKKPIPSPAVLGQVTARFRSRVKEFAEEGGIPWVEFKHGERKDTIANTMRAERGIVDGVVFVGVAQEKTKSYSAKQSRENPGWFEFGRDKTAYVNHYYFYVDDIEFGAGFIKVCSYAPWGLKVCLNGHEWAKRQAEKKGLRFEALDNGFLSCEAPEKLQEICDGLSATDIEGFLMRWLGRLPMPLNQEDVRAGYGWRLSIWQMEVSLTQIFDRPVRGREFFEEVIRDNMDLGRPDRVQLIFEKRITKKTPGAFRTRVIQEGVSPSLHIEYRDCDLKQYFKEGRGLRTETTFRNPGDFGVNKGVENLSYLRDLGHHINRRLLEVERVSQNCGLSAESIQRVVQPTVTKDGQKAPGLRFGDPRVMALMLALTLFTHGVNGFRSAGLRLLVSDLLGPTAKPYSSGQASYDLRRLCRKGLIARKPRTNRYFLTPYGWKVARFYSRLEARVLRPLSRTLHPDGVVDPQPALTVALNRVDAQLDILIDAAFPLRRAA